MTTKVLPSRRGRKPRPCILPTHETCIAHRSSLLFQAYVIEERRSSGWIHPDSEHKLNRIYRQLDTLAILHNDPEWVVVRRPVKPMERKRKPKDYCDTCKAYDTTLEALAAHPSGGKDDLAEWRHIANLKYEHVFNVHTRPSGMKANPHA